MQSPPPYKKPRVRAAVGTARAVAMTAVLVAILGSTILLLRRYGALDWPFYAFLLLVVGVLTFLSRTTKEPPTPAGRTLRIANGKLQQVAHSGEVLLEIELTRDFEYRFLENEQDENARVRVYQGSRALTFYTSDPGAAEAIRTALRRPWPSPLTMRARVREGRIP